jgi:hypothetical protein
MMLERKLGQMRATQPTVTWDEFKQVALEYCIILNFFLRISASFNIKDIEDSQLSLVAQFFHGTGVLLHYDTNSLQGNMGEVEERGLEAQCIYRARYS